MTVLGSRKRESNEKENIFNLFFHWILWSVNRDKIKNENNINNRFSSLFLAQNFSSEVFKIFRVYLLILDMIFSGRNMKLIRFCMLFMHVRSSGLHWFFLLYFTVVKIGNARSDNQWAQAFLVLLISFSYRN